jgi:hypothetical protein
MSEVEKSQRTYDQWTTALLVDGSEWLCNRIVEFCKVHPQRVAGPIIQQLDRRTQEIVDVQTWYCPVYPELENYREKRVLVVEELFRRYFIVVENASDYVDRRQS